MPEHRTREEKIQLIRHHSLTGAVYATMAGVHTDGVHIRFYRQILQSSVSGALDSDYDYLWNRARVSSRDQADRHLNLMVKVISGETPAAPPEPARPLVTANSINTTDHLPAEDIGKILKMYGHNMAVGFEFEMAPINRQASVIISEICNHFGIREGKKTSRIVEMNGYVAEPGGEQIPVKIPMLMDAYKSHEIVSGCYADGSVGPETVTRPITLDMLDVDIKPVHDYLKTKGNFNSPSAGLHMTFVLDKHKEKSTFHKLVVKNCIQLIRTYYPLLVMKYKNPTCTRRLNFRLLPFKEQTTSVTTDKYHGINLRKTRTGDIWALEMRIPDATDDWAIIKEQVLVYMCLIRHAARISTKGLLVIPRPYWRKVQEFTSGFGMGSGARVWEEIKQPLETQFNSVIEQEMKFFSYSEEKMPEYQTTNLDGE